MKWREEQFLEEGDFSKKKGCWTDKKKNKCPLRLSGLCITHNLTTFLRFWTPIFNYCWCKRNLRENIYVILGTCFFLIDFRSVFWMVSLIILTNTFHSLNLAKQSNQAMWIGPETGLSGPHCKHFSRTVDKVSRVQFSWESVSSAGVCN